MESQHSEDGGIPPQESEGPLSTIILSQLHDALEGAASGSHPLTTEDINLITAFVSNLNPASNDGLAAPPETERAVGESGGGGDDLADLEETTQIAGMYECRECGV